MLELFDLLHANQINYVIWKNAHELSEGLSGDRDIDVLVSRSSRASAVKLLQNSGWVRLVEISITYPDVEHFYKIAEGKIFHLNIYFSVVTGESWLKEYRLNLEEFLLENKEQNDEGLWVLSHAAQAYIFYLRHKIKNGSLLSRFVYKSELSSYKQEWLRCYQNTQQVTGLEGEIDTTELQKFGLNHNDIAQPSYSTALAARWQLFPSLRFNFLLLPLVRYWYLARKIYFRKIQKRKKEAPLGGMVLAICGGDGSGKTTLLKHLNTVYSSFMTVKQIHLGKPQNKLVEAIRKTLFKVEKKEPSSSASAEKIKKVKPTFKLALTVFVLAFLRLRLAKKARRLADKGYLVISDRWPTNQQGYMDGPKPKPAGDLPFLQSKLWSFIEAMYAQMPKADAAITLQVGLDAALERNRNREDAERDEEAHIIKVHTQYADHKPLAHEVIYLNNNVSLDEAKLNIIKISWKAFSERVV